MMHTVLVSVTTFVAVVALGGFVLMLRSGRKDRLRNRLRPGHSPSTGGGEARRRLLRVLEGVGQKAALGGPSPRLQQQLARAGYYGNHAGSLYLGAKVFLLLTGAAGLSCLIVPLDLPMPLKVFTIVVGATLLSFVPNLVTYFRRQQRCQMVRRHLPDALDLLEISVASGMGLDAAWNAVADEMRIVCPVLADEMALTNLELHLGARRADALRHMGDRTGAEEISSLVAVLVQSDRFGTSIAETLRTFAASMRELRSFQAEEAAEKMAVKLLFPMVLFIFPSILIVAAGPAGIVLADLISGK